MATCGVLSLARMFGDSSSWPGIPANPVSGLRHSRYLPGSASSKYYGQGTAVSGKLGDSFLISVNSDLSRIDFNVNESLEGASGTVPHEVNS